MLIPPRLALVALAVLLAVGAPVLRSESSQPSPSADLFFKPDEFSWPAISPDGKNIGFIAQSGGHGCLFRLDLESGQISGVFSAGEGDVEAFWWTGNKRVLIAARGRDNLTYLIQDLANSKPRPVDTIHNWSSDWIKILPQDPDHIVGFNKRIDLNTGKYTLIEYASADNIPVFSSAGEIRAKIWAEMGKWHITWRANLKDPWHTLTSSAEDYPPFVPWDVDVDDSSILVLANDQGNTQALMRLDPKTGNRALVAQRPDRDILWLVTTGPEQRPIGVEFFSLEAQDVVYFDQADAQFSAALDRSLPGMLHRVTSASKDGTKRIIEAWPPGYPSRYFLYDGAAGRLSQLGEARPGIAPGALGDVEFFKFKSRDGLAEHGYVVVPKPTSHPGPLPMIVRAIDGAADPLPAASRFNAQDQYFASRGYAVAHIAVRGTPGFGRAFKNAGDFQLANKVVDDLDDAIDYLGRTGRIDPRRVAILGDNLGGLSALHTAAVSTRFHAVVAYNPTCDLTATSIGWLSSSRADTPTIVKQAGGTKAAYELVHQFEPDSFMDKLNVSVMLVNTSWYGFSNNTGGKKIRGSMDRHHKTYEWFELDLRDYERIKNETYLSRINTKIADYLDQTLR